MPRTSDGMIRAVRAAHDLLCVVAKILGVEAAKIGKRAEASLRVAREIAKAQAAIVAKSWRAGLIEFSEPEIAELEQRLGMGFQAKNQPQSYPKPTPQQPHNNPTTTPQQPQIYPAMIP